jgi:hypothetical protein
MFNYTQAAAHKIGNDIRKAAFYFNLFSPIIYIAYLIINLFTKPDFFSINLVLLLITTAYFGFFIYTSCKNVNAYIKKTVNRVYKYSKFILKALVLAILIYGVIIENGTPSLSSILMLVFSAIALLLSILLELLARIIEWWITLIVEGVKMDFAPLAKTFSFFKPQDPTPPTPPTPIQEKAQVLLEELAPAMKAKKVEAKKAKKAAAKQAKLKKREAKKQAKKEEKEARKQRN